MAPPNPYFIYIELFKSDGVTRPNQNEIARVRAYDVNGSVVVWEGESGFNPNNGNWYPVYMQNLAAFYPPREKPNLKFEVWNTAEQLVHTTQVFGNIPSASTVKIVIGVSDQLVTGGGSRTWVVSGTVRHQDGTPLTFGTVRAFDITNGSTKQLGFTQVGAGGSYSISYTTADFTNNGGAHATPNLTVRVFDANGTLLGQAGPVSASQNQVLDVTVPNESTGPGPGTKRRVFGTVKNPLDLPVAGIVVQAYHVGWTLQGLQEFPLHPATPLVLSDGAGNYEILYDAPIIETPQNPCGTPAGQVNLIVYARQTEPNDTLTTLFTSEIVFDAPTEQRVDLRVNKTAVSTDSEYARIDAALTPCLGEGDTEAAKWAALNMLNQRPEYLAFVAETSGIDEALLRAYVRAWIVAGEINQKVPASALSKPMSPEVIYGLFRVLEADTLPDLLNVAPESFFETLVRAISRGIVSTALESQLQALLADWRIVLTKLMGRTGSGFQSDLLNLVFPDSTRFPEVAQQAGTAFAAAVTAHNVNLPTGVVAGDLLVVLFANGGATSITVTPPANWTPLFSTPSGTAAPVRFGIYVKLATGPEGGTANFTTSAGAQSSANAYRISKDSWKGDLTTGVSVKWTHAAGTGNAINPASLTTTGWDGTNKTLWLACGAHATNATATGAPPQYSTPTLRTPSGTSAGNCTTLSVYRQNAVATEDPGSFGLAASAAFVAATVAVREGLVSLAAKREAVVSAYFNFQGSFAELVAALLANATLVEPEGENLRFVFELYERVDRHFPTVALLYSKKVGQGWHTVQDLAKLPLNGDPGGNDWYHYLLSLGSSFPADVPGNKTEEKAGVYAARLYDLFRETGAQTGYAADVAAAAASDPTLGPIAVFLAEAEDFDLDRTNIDEYVAKNPGALPEDSVDKLKQLQRIYRLTPDFAAASALINATPPLDSAVKIARLDEGAFIAEWEEHVGGLTAARDIHRTASHYAAEVMFTLVKFHQNLNEAGGLRAVPRALNARALAAALDPKEGLLEEGTITEGGLSDTRKFPNWVTLFGSLNQCACKECQTALGPGAYLVDLLEFVDGAPRRTLFERRPDLEDIELTCANTNTVLPYIDLVNETLEAVVAPLRFVFALPPDVTTSPAVPDVETAFDWATGATSTPVQQTAGMTVIRAALLAQGYALVEQARVKKGAADRSSKREWAIEDDAWRFSVHEEGSAFAVYPAPQTSANNDSLEVFPEHVNVKAYENHLETAIFPFSLPLDLGREETNIFLKAKNVPHYQVLEAFRVGSPEEELRDPAIARSYFELGQSEVTAILGQTQPARTLWGFTADTQEIPRPDAPTLTVSGNWIHLMSLVPVFQHRSGLRYPELLDLLDTEFVHRYAAPFDVEALPHGIHLAAPDEALLECQVSEFQIAHLTAPVLQRISFFVRLWRKLGWTMRDLDRYLVELEQNEIPAPYDPDDTDLSNRLVRLYQIKRLADQLGLSPRTVIAFFRPMDTRRTERHPKSLFDEVFLDGSKVLLEIQALEQIARGQTLDLEDRPPNEDLRAHVRGALRLKAEDMDLLWQRFVVESATPDVLDIGKLTDMYRVAALAGALKLTVAELFDLEALFGSPILPAGTAANLRTAILAVHARLRDARAARLTDMSAAQMSYYLTDAHDEDDSFALTDAKLEAAARSIAAAASAIGTVNPEQANVDAAALSTALAKVIPADKVVRAVDIVEGPPSPPNLADFPSQAAYDEAVAAYTALLTANRGFLVRYFAPFLPIASSEQTAFLDRLVNFNASLPPEQDLEARYQLVWARLRDHLVNEARTTAAIALAAELTNTSEDVANTLLTQSLTSVADATAPALDDWKAALAGGWNTGEATLESAPPTTAQRRGTFVASKGGEHRFVGVITPGAGTDLDLWIELDGESVPLTEESSTVRGNVREVVFSPVTLRAGGAYPLTLMFAGPAAARLTLSLRVGNDDPSVVPSTAVVSFEPTMYVAVFKAAGLVQGLELTKTELRHLVEDPSVFALDALPVNGEATLVPWSALKALLELLDLNRTVRLKTGTLFEFWRDTVPTFATPAEAIAAVALQTAWKEEDLRAVRGEDPGATSLWAPDPTPAWDEPALWFALRDVFTIVRRLDVRLRQVVERLVAEDPSIASAGLLRSIFRGQFSRDAWKEVMKPLRDRLRQRQRDALVGYLTTRSVPLPGGGTGKFVDANDLFAFFMIDVEMEPDTLISRIKLALNVVQLFVHRVFLGLEDAASLGELAPKKEQWAWMEKYRVWEANRKIFLYPENWIEPDLRDDKTEFFTELEDELTQAPLTHETAMQALTSYLDKMNEVSNLEVIGSFAEGRPADGENFTLHVIGRTRSRSRSLFYRTFHGKQAYDGYWTPWKRVDLEIDADVIVPVVTNGKLHLFWPKILTKERPREHDFSEGNVSGENQGDFKSSERIQYQSEIRLMWSEYNAKKNKWGKPKVSKSRGIDNNAPTPFQRDIGDDQPRTENYHLRVHLESLHVAVDLVKTNVPTEPRTIIFNVRPVKVLFWTFYLPIPEILETATLFPTMLGTFRIWESGDDGFDVNGAATSFGQNYPIGTVMKANAAVEVDFSVDNKVASDKLQLGTNAAFLARTPDFFRIFETNFNYMHGADQQPFFYETPLKSLFALNKPSVAVPALSLQASQSVKFSTFNHPLVEVFQKELRYHGLEGLMHRLVEALPVADDRYYSSYYYDYYYGSLYLGYHIAGDHRSLYTTQRIFESEHVPGPTVKPLYPLPTVEFGYGTSFGVYNWELFFHVPMLIAGRLGGELRFDEAMRWYHSVFDPKQELNRYELTRSWVESLPPGCRYWNFLPLFANRKAEDSLLDTLGLTTKLSHYERDDLAALISEWRNTPFNPHLIARARVQAYQKFVVMKYLDNLIAWADSLFRQDTFETINEATQLYILADELLGSRPEIVEPLVAEPRLTYRELRAKGIDDFSNAIVEVESLIVTNQPHLKDTVQPPAGASMMAIKNLALRSFYFRIPRNERLDRYWDTVQDRLFKIRNSMNIDGVKRRLALFEPPIDPALLVRAAAAGLDIGSVLAALNAPLPCYRFQTWIGKATELANEVKGYGAALLAALEKKDGEALSLLRQGQELKMLALVKKVREQQVKEAEENITALELSRALAEERKEFYRTRVRINQGEQSQIDKTKAATRFEVAQSAAHALSALFAPVPDSKSGMVGPFPTGIIDLKIGTALVSIANAAGAVAGAFAAVNRGEATLAGIRAGHDRRWDDWKLQERLAQKEIDQLNQQIAIAAIRLDIAQKELENHEQQIEHAEEMQTFLEDKFTNRELYSWMSSELTRTYNALYKLAYDAARAAERTYQFELGTSNESFIQFGYVDSLRQGLLAGEKLLLDIKRMELSYLERNKRELEIAKPVSLAAFDAQAVQALREQGFCDFELPEVLFDLDFPGHYFRRIKGVRLTIPCVTGPHTSVSAKLSLVGSAYRREATPGASYPYQGFGDTRFVHDPVAITSIATGRAQGDSGLFEFNFRDERYLPFEGAGAVSRWRLELPTAFRQFDYHTISDVVLELNYTARDAGGILRVAAEGAIEEGLNSIRELAGNDEAEASGLVRVFSLKKEFPDVFHRLMTEGAATAAITAEHFPFVIRHAGMSMSIVSGGAGPQNPIDIHVVPKAGFDLDSTPASFTLNGGTASTMSVNEETGVGVATVAKSARELLASWNPESWLLTQTGLTTATADDVVLIVRYSVAA